MNQADAVSQSSMTWLALGKTALALGVVIAIILLCAWGLRRIQQGNRYGKLPTKVVSSHALGQRERVVVLDIDDKRLVLGVTPQNINLLTELEQTPIEPQENPPLEGRFSERFKQAFTHNLSKKKGGT